MSKAKKSAKKEIRSKIAEQLTTTFGDLKERISAKKFERNVRKASRILLEGIKKPKKVKAVEISQKKQEVKVKKSEVPAS